MSDKEQLAKGVRWALDRLSGSRHHKAVRLGVSLATVQNWYAGTSVPTEGNLARLARLAGTDQETVRQGGEWSNYEENAS